MIPHDAIDGRWWQMRKRSLRILVITNGARLRLALRPTIEDCLMPNLTLVSHDLCPYVQRAVIVLAEKSVPNERHYIDLADKPDWFRKISPLGKVLLPQIGDVMIFEPAVICEYLDKITPGSLHPRDPLQKAQHHAWVEFASAILRYC
jgi:glutathione S-transferase